MRIVFVVPARGGSKGLPGKNLRTVAGTSLVGRAVAVARRALRRAGGDGAVVVDTDDGSIAREGRSWGAEVPFLRPPELATDTASTVDVVLHLLSRLPPADVVVLLQPTSPLRAEEDVARCLAALGPGGSAVAVVRDPHHHLGLRRGADGVLSWIGEAPSMRRQDHGPVVAPSGSVYVTTPASLREHRSFVVSGRTVGVEVPAERAVDVDTERDLVLAEALARTVVPRTVPIGHRAIGPGHPCFVIAEAGVNHDGDIARAHALVDAAADAGADAVKFQTFDPKKLASQRAPMAAYQEANTGVRESQLAMLEKLTLPRSAHAELVRHAADRGILFLSTPFDEGSADFLEALGLPAFKIPSGEITNLPFLEHVARKGRPMLVSTGMAEMVEIARALDALDATTPDLPVAVFQCVTSYPAAIEDSNLRAIDTIRAAFGVPAGLSDHTEGIAVAMGSVTAGAAMIEKHFTVDRSLPGPDHKASLEPDELAAMIRGIRQIEAALGDGIKRPRPAELPLRDAARKSLYAARALEAGSVLVREDLIALRPGTGISPAELGRLVGRRLVSSLEEGELLEERHVG